MEQNYLNYEKDLNSKIDDFFSLYNKFMNKNEEENNENIEEFLLIQKKIDPIIFEIEEIFQFLFENLNKNSIKIKEIERKHKKFQEMKNKYKNKYNEIINSLILENNNITNEKKNNNITFENNYKKNNNKISNEKNSNLNDFEIIENNNNNNNEKKEINFNFDEKNMSEEEINDIINGAQKVQLYFDKYQNSEEYQQKKNEELKEISKLMSTIKDLMSTINQQLYEDDEKIQSIEDCIDESIENVKKGNQQLKKAAKDTVDSRKIKYCAVIGTTLCALGTICPGIGNVIGGALGIFIGKKIANYEKNKIKKIEKKYS
jgi:hypothetical protein